MQHTKLKGYFLDDKEHERIESLWALPIGDNYKIDNIPFFIQGISCGDIVSSKIINGELFIDSLVEASGNSTIRIVFFDINLLNQTRETLKQLGCDSELSHLPNLISVNIPAEVNYRTLILPYLKEGQARNNWDYEEACLAHR